MIVDPSAEVHFEFLFTMFADSQQHLVLIEGSSTVCYQSICRFSFDAVMVGSHIPVSDKF